MVTGEDYLFFQFTLKNLVNHFIVLGFYFRWKQYSTIFMFCPRPGTGSLMLLLNKKSLFSRRSAIKIIVDSKNVMIQVGSGT